MGGLGEDTATLRWHKDPAKSEKQCVLGKVMIDAAMTVMQVAGLWPEPSGFQDQVWETKIAPNWVHEHLYAEGGVKPRSGLVSTGLTELLLADDRKYDASCCLSFSESFLVRSDGS